MVKKNERISMAELADLIVFGKKPKRQEVLFPVDPEAQPDQEIPVSGKPELETTDAVAGGEHDSN